MEERREGREEGKGKKEGEKRENMNEMGAGKNFSRGWASWYAFVKERTSTHWSEQSRGSSLKEKLGPEHSGSAQQSGRCGVWREATLAGWWGPNVGEP